MRLSVSSNRAGRGLEFLARFLNLSGSVEVAKVAGDVSTPHFLPARIASAQCQAGA